MARSKNSPALFEVIRNAQQKQKELLERQQQQKLNAELHAHSPAAALLRSPLYWFKGKQAHEAAIAGQPVMREVPATPAADPTAGVSAQSFRQPAIRQPAIQQPAVQPPEEFTPAPIEATFAAPDIHPAHFDEPQAAVLNGVEDLGLAQPPLFGADSYEATAPSYTPATLSAAALAARQVREELSAQEAPAAEPLFGAPTYGRTSISSPFGLDADADEPKPRQFAIQLNYTSAVIAGFALLVAIAVAVIISTASKKEDKGTIAKSNVRPDVLDVTKNTAKTPANPSNITPIAPTNTVIDEDARASMAGGGESIGLDTLGKPIPVPTNVKRVVGYQYMVLLSFPREEDAKELVKFLAQNGVPATAEKALPDYAKSWTSVVTTRGFERTKNNTAFASYSDALKGLLQKYAGDSKFRKTFKIDVYTWRTAR